jgi:hypothetical protein
MASRRTWLKSTPHQSASDLRWSARMVDENWTVEDTRAGNEAPQT